MKETTTMKNTFAPLTKALIIRDVIIGKIEVTGFPVEKALAEADAHFAAEGVIDRESYVAYVARLKETLRETAVAIRAAKYPFRKMDGLTPGYWEARRHLDGLHALNRQAHDLRVLGKVWSARKRTPLSESAAA